MKENVIITVSKSVSHSVPENWIVIEYMKTLEIMKMLNIQNWNCKHWQQNNKKKMVPLVFGTVKTTYTELYDFLNTLPTTASSRPKNITIRACKTGTILPVRQFTFCALSTKQFNSFKADRICL